MCGLCEGGSGCGGRRVRRVSVRSRGRARLCVEVSVVVTVTVDCLDMIQLEKQAARFAIPCFPVSVYLPFLGELCLE